VTGDVTGDVTGAVAGLGARVGLPHSVGGLGLDRTAMVRVARRAAEDPANLTNPRHAVAADYLRMLEAAL
jgi:alcohol dehydrogenase class IV